MIIRKEQMQAFEEVRLPEFEDYMVKHLKDFSPLHADHLDEIALRAFIGDGVNRAKGYGFVSHGSLRFFIEARVLLGSEFDTDPQYPWVSDLLNNPTVRSPLQRADQLHAMLMTFLETVGGPSREYAIEALRRLKAEAAAFPESPPTESHDALISRMQTVYPEKAAFLGLQTLQKLVCYASQEAPKLGFTTHAGASLFFGLMFIIGHGFARDPLYPWIAETLDHAVSDEPARRVSRLWAKAIKYLDRVVHNFDGT